MIRLGVTGTDTGVGKTVVASAILAAFRARGMRVAGMKPIETGVAPEDPDSDAMLLRDAAGVEDSFTDVCPIVMPFPLAPMVAARRTGVTINLTALDAAFARLSLGRAAVVVESAGGLLDPITNDIAYDSLFRRWELDVVVVAANRLGAINHARLTIQAARQAKLVVRALVLDELHPESGDADRTNPDALGAIHPDIPIVTFPWVREGRDFTALARAAEECGLIEMLVAE